jgi:hypothetical protein
MITEQSRPIFMKVLFNIYALSMEAHSPIRIQWRHRLSPYPARSDPTKEATISAQGFLIQLCNESQGSIT